MTTDPDPFEEGQRAARENIPAEGNPYQDGSEEHALWAAGHERVAGEAEADESEGALKRAQLQPGLSSHRQLRSKRSLRRGSCAGFCNSQNIQTNAAPRQTTVARNITVIWAAVIIVIMDYSVHTACP